IVYLGTSAGVFKSIDGGANWNSLNEGLTNRGVQILAATPDNSHTLYAGTAAGVFKIVDESRPANPMDDAGFFIQQHYRDFLNREPDADGFAFWVNGIASCGSDPQCLEV